MNILYDLEAQSIYEKLPPLVDSFTLDEINNFDMDNYYKQFISNELLFRLFSSFEDIVLNNNFGKNNDIEVFYNSYLDFIKPSFNFDYDELRQIINSAISFRINSFLKPFSLLNFHLFTNNNFISKLELFLKFKYLDNNSFASELLISFYNYFKNNNYDYIIRKNNFQKFSRGYLSSFFAVSNNLRNYIIEIRTLLNGLGQDFNISYLQMFFTDLNYLSFSEKINADFDLNDDNSIDELINMFNDNYSELVDDNNNIGNQNFMLDLDNSKNSYIGRSSEIDNSTSDEASTIVPKIELSNLEKIEILKENELNDLDISKPFEIERTELSKEILETTKIIDDEIKQSENISTISKIDIDKYLETNYDDESKSNPESKAFDLGYSIEKEIYSLLKLINK